MNARLSIFFQLLIISALFVAQSFAVSTTPIAPPIAVYPQYRLTPASPTTQDSVSLRIVKGINGNSCVPQYITSFSIEKVIVYCFMGPCPPLNVIKISYTQSLIQPLQNEIACLNVMTEYGPVFNFGKLPAGNYEMIDTVDSNRTRMMFTIADSPKLFTISGTVTEDVGTSKVVIVVKNAKVYLKKPLYYVIPNYAMPIVPDSTIDSAITDGLGSFVFKNIKQESYTLSISATDYQAQNVSLSLPFDTTISVNLLSVNALGTVTGTVYQATPPGVVGCGYSPVGCVTGIVEGCTVSVSLPLIILPMGTNAQALLPTPSSVYKAVTNSQGAYTIDSIPITYANRTIAVVAKKDGFAQDSKAATMQPGQPVLVYFALQLPYANKTQKTVNNITYTVATDKASYNRGENINVRYTIKNNSTATVTFTFGGCPYDMLATTPSGDTAYWYMKNRACTMIIQMVPLAPGDSMLTDFPAFTYTDTARSLTVTAALEGLNYNTSAVSVLVAINQAVTPVLQKDMKKVSRKNGPLVTYTRSSKTIALTSDRPQLVSISAYTLNGRKVAELSGNRFLPVGTQAILLKNAAFYGGIILFRIQGEGFIQTARINLIK